MDDHPITVSDEADFGAIIPAAIDDYGLTPHEFRIYAHLRRRVGKNVDAWPSRATIAITCRMNKATVLSSLHMLEKFGIVTVRPVKGETNRYVLNGVREWRTDSHCIRKEVLKIKLEKKKNKTNPTPDLGGVNTTPDLGPHPTPDLGPHPTPDLGDKGKTVKDRHKDSPSEETSLDQSKHLDLPPQPPACVVAGTAPEKIDVSRAVKIWARYLGVFAHGRMGKALKEAVKQHGNQAVMEGLARYARDADPRFNPSPEKFCAVINKWLPKAPTQEVDHSQYRAV